jgi:hypothetical protein
MVTLFDIFTTLLTVCESKKAGNHSSKLKCHEKYVMPVWVLVTQCLYSVHFQAFCISFGGWAKIWYPYSMEGRTKNCCLFFLLMKPEVHLNNIKNSISTAQETDCVFIAKTMQLILFREVISFFWDSHEKQVYVPLGKWRFFILKQVTFLCFEGLMCTLLKVYYWT